MTANELQKYLMQVVDMESNLMGLRASYEALKMRDNYYKSAGTEVSYSVSALSAFYGFGDRLSNESDVKREISNMPMWLKCSCGADDAYEEDEEYEENEEYEDMDRKESYSVYVPFARKPLNEIRDSIERSDNDVRFNLFRNNFKAPEVVKDPLLVIEKVQEPTMVPEAKHINISPGKRIFWSVYSILFGAICGYGFISVFLVTSGAFDHLTGAIIGSSIGSVILYFLMKYSNTVREKKAEQYDAYLNQKKAYDEYVSKKRQLYNIDRFAGTKAKFKSAFDHAAKVASAMYEEFAVKRNRAIEAEIVKLKKQIRESEEVLNRLYAMNILHPKYRNLAAASTIFEYLETGRCTELTGHEGAYNLYESELRQNLIIAKLDVVIQKLDELKATMYRCCMAIENVGKQIQGLEKELKTLNSTAFKQLEVQKDTLRLTALNTTYSAAIAANTEAIKYLTLVQ